MDQAVINYILSGVALAVTMYLGWSQHQSNKWTRRMVGEIHDMHIELHEFLKETTDECDAELSLLSRPEQHSSAPVHKAARVLHLVRDTGSGEISQPDLQEA